MEFYYRICFGRTGLGSNWYHVALTWDNGYRYFYLNGSEDASGTYSGLTTIDDDACIGDLDTSSPYEEWAGKIDDIQIWDVALTEK